MGDSANCLDHWTKQAQTALTVQPANPVSLACEQPSPVLHIDLPLQLLASRPELFMSLAHADCFTMLATHGVLLLPLPVGQLCLVMSERLCIFLAALPHFRGFKQGCSSCWAGGMLCLVC